MSRLCSLAVICLRALSRGDRDSLSRSRAKLGQTVPGADFQPAVKWTGSKRLVAREIADLLPDDGTYYEPFVGSGAVLYAANPSNAVAGDRCEPLVELWRLVRDDPERLAQYYRRAWHRLRDEGEDAYYDIREQFNDDRDPRKLLFLTRTSVNGLVRFNDDGEFNASLHLSRDGMRPTDLAGVLSEWSRRLNGVDFRADDYADTLAGATAGDVVFLDPPYFNADTLYYGEFDVDRFLDELKRLRDAGVRYALTLDGTAGDHEYAAEVPEWAYEERRSLETGTSPYRKVVGGETADVTQSLYLSFETNVEQATLDAY